MGKKVITWPSWKKSLLLVLWKWPERSTGNKNIFVWPYIWGIGNCSRTVKRHSNFVTLSWAQPYQKLSETSLKFFCLVIGQFRKWGPVGTMVTKMSCTVFIKISTLGHSRIAGWLQGYNICIIMYNICIILYMGGLESDDGGHFFEGALIFRTVMEIFLHPQHILHDDVIMYIHRL